MTCPKCGGTNVSVQVVNTDMSTRSHKRGCLWSLGRLFLIICTLGLWWLFVGKSKGKSKTKVKSESQAVCQACGSTWTV